MSGFRARLAAIALGGLVVRVLWIALGDWTPARLIGDAGFYHDVALLVARGEGFTLPGSPGVPTAAHPPLHPLVLALPSALGLTGWTAHRLVGALIGSLTVALVGLLGRRAGGERAGLAAAGLAALYPVFVRIDGSVMSETLYGALIAGCLLAAYRVIDRPSVRAAGLLGALVGLATLTRAEAVLLMALLAIPLVAAGPPAGRVARVAAVCAVAAVVVAPWTLRNWSAFDRFVPVSTNGGSAIAGANCARTYSGPDLGFWRFDCLSLPPPHSRNEAARSERLMRKGTAYASDHAGRLAYVVPVRVLRTFDLYQPWRQARFSEGGHVTLYRVGAAAFWLLAAFGAWGAVLLRRRGEPVWVLLAPVALAALTAALTLGAARLRYAAEIPLLALAGVALARLRLPGRARPARASASGPPEEGRPAQSRP